MLLVLHNVPTANEIYRRGLLVWRDDRGEWKASNGDPGKAALELLITKYATAIEAFEQAESNATHAEDYLPILEGLSPLSRASKHLLEVLQEARTAFPDATEIIDWRDQAYEMSREADLTYQFSKDSLDVAVIKRAEEQAAASNRMALAAHKLNVMAALFFPLATLGAIFGTSLTENWSWSNSPLAFVCFLAVGIGSGIALARYITPKPS